MPTKTRVLWVGEFHELNTGYSVYARELLNRLCERDDIEVAELACYCLSNHPKVESWKWKIYPNVPHPQDKEANDRYHSHPANALGIYSFDNVILDFKPHIVLDIRDVFAFSFEDICPYRNTYLWAVMPTVDAQPQHPQWLDILGRANYILTYQNWSLDLLRNTTNNRLNLVGTASPSADDAFVPKNKSECKAKLNLHDFKILGTVMRNQPRKQFPTLFKSFARYLKESKRDDVVLYCHTSYPDNSGWDFPRLLNQYGIASKVFFTYVCKECGDISAKHFSGTVCACNKCGRGSSMFPNVQSGVSNEELSNIYNAMDVYVQLANSEGMGMPAVEAGACGIPVLATNYSAMEDVVKRLGGIPIPLYTTYTDRTMGCDRAIPDESSFVKIISNVFNMSNESITEWSNNTRKSYTKHYSWDKVAQAWYNIIKDASNHAGYLDSVWHSPPNIRKPAPPNYNMSNIDFAKFLILDVLCQPELLYSYMHLRLEKELNIGTKDVTDYGMYYHVSTAPSIKDKFNKEIAYKHFVDLRERLNSCERLRYNIVNQNQKQIGHLGG
jgi:glycosyltransferase involved in cell wall biosynthesis